MPSPFWFQTRKKSRFWVSENGISKSIAAGHHRLIAFNVKAFAVIGSTVPLQDRILWPLKTHSGLTRRNRCSNLITDLIAYFVWLLLYTDTINKLSKLSRLSFVSMCLLDKYTRQSRLYQQAINVHWLYHSIVNIMVIAMIWFIIYLKMLHTSHAYNWKYIRF